MVLADDWGRLERERVKSELSLLLKTENRYKVGEGQAEGLCPSAGSPKNQKR
jgi:hypothetical protein